MADAEDYQDHHGRTRNRYHNSIIRDHDVRLTASAGGSIYKTRAMVAPSSHSSTWLWNLTISLFYYSVQNWWGVRVFLVRLYNGWLRNDHQHTLQLREFVRHCQLNSVKYEIE